VDATAVYNQEQREYMRLNIPLDSINQFQVQSKNFGADVQGGAAGGQVAVVSPSGTNGIHGDLFDYFRNDELEARTPFNGAQSESLPVEPIRRWRRRPHSHDKTFFYRNYEGLRQRLDGTQIGLVPGPNFIAQASSLAAPMPILNGYPIGTTPTSNKNVWNYAALGSTLIMKTRARSGWTRPRPVRRSERRCVCFGVITSSISGYATGRGTPREFQRSARIVF
jgi:hypothetical protein